MPLIFQVTQLLFLSLAAVFCVSFLITALSSISWAQPYDEEPSDKH